MYGSFDKTINFSGMITYTGTSVAGGNTTRLFNGSRVLSNTRSGSNYKGPLVPPPSYVDSIYYQHKREIIGFKKKPITRVFTRTYKYGKKKGESYKVKKVFWIREPIWRRVTIPIRTSKLVHHKKPSFQGLPPNTLRTDITKYQFAEHQVPLEFYRYSESYGLAVGLIEISQYAYVPLFGSQILFGVNPASLTAGQNNSWQIASGAKALTRMYANARTNLPNYAQFYAERGKALASFCSFATNLLQVVLKIKSLRFVEAGLQLIGKDTKSIAKNYLQLQYGIIPTLIDLDGIAHDIQKSMQQSKEHLEAKSFTGTSNNTYSSTWTVNCFPLGSFKVSQRVQRTTKAVARYTVNKTLMRSLSTRGITNPEGLVWELVPFSFIVDWFVNIGAWIGSSHTFEGLNVNSFYFTHFEKVSSTIEFTPTTVQGVNGYYPKHGGGTQVFAVESISVSRQLTGLPALAMPQLKNPFSTKHVSILLALIHSLRK